MPQSILSDRDHELAIHEAGHAALLLSRPFLWGGILFATILPRKDSDGGVQLARPGFELVARFAQKEHAMVLIAGLSAQTLACEKRNPGVDRFSAFTECEPCGQDDLSKLERLGVSYRQTFRLVDECIARLDPLWRKVEALAMELENHRTLFHEEASMIFNGDLRGVEKYRKEREGLIVAPHPKWVEGFPAGEAGQWFADAKTSAYQAARERLRSFLGRKP